MKTSKQVLGAAQTVIALAVLAALNPVQAQQNDLAKPTSWIGAGAGGVSGNSADRAQWGIYNGMRKDSGYLLLDLDYASRGESGLWTKFSGRNLGLDNRELSFSQSQQGNWKYALDFSEITRHDFRTINTGMSGIGSAAPTIVRIAAPGAGTDVDLKTERKAFTLAGEKWFGGTVLFEASFKSEDKEGARQWGRGYDCAAYVCGTNTQWTTAQATTYQLTNVKNAILMVAEPVSSNIKQWEAKLSFRDEKLAATAGYYGSFYTNSNGSLNPIVPNLLNNGIGQPGTLYPVTPNGVAAAGGGMSLQQVLQSALALPPDNQAHQFYVSGNYSFTPTAKATFKYAYTHATQDRSFASQGLGGAPFGAGSLQGVVDTNLVQFGFTAKPIDKLSLLANWRYENKEDKTPNRLYNVEAVTLLAGAGTTPTSYSNSNLPNNLVATWNNNHQTATKVSGKLEASYQFPAKIKATLGYDYSSTEREVPKSLEEEKVAGIGTLRAKNAENGYRLELKSNMWESFSGALAYAHSERDGSDWTSLSTIDATVATTSANNAALSRLFCGGVLCYGQALPAANMLAMAPTTNFPMNMTDLERDKWKLSASWNPSERLSLQFLLEQNKDKNTSPINGAAQALSPATLGRGWRGSDSKFANVDASFALSEGWRLSAYASRGEQTLDINHSVYLANMKTTTDAFGIGVAGKLSSALQVGADLGYFNDVTASKYGVAAAASLGTVSGSTITYVAPAAITATNAAQAAIGTPDVSVRKTTLALFANYALAPASSIRVDLVHLSAKVADWIWGIPGNPFYYADNTTVKQQADQKVTYLGAKYIYKWQ